MTTIYRAGGVKSDTSAGFRTAWAVVGPVAGVTFTDNLGQPFVVTAGKTYYIGTVFYSGYRQSIWYLGYDNDGAGTGKVLCGLFATDWPVQAVDASSSITAEVVIPVPSGKYLRGYSDSASYWFRVTMVGQEV